ncbi:LmeA family phospholipid-binding protein [Streptomyces buecherae]|uniref:LmeA family phospholipid-binding protein n=1 Tax=Streptomyces buecherae TaxID=2763006 RepID=UPI0036512906
MSDAAHTDAASRGGPGGAPYHQGAGGYGGGYDAYGPGQPAGGHGGYDDYDDRAAPPPRRRRRGRGLRVLLILLVILGGLFVAADRIAVNVVESEAAKKIKSKENLTGTPEVSIKGFPFLTQVVSKKFDEIEVTFDGLTSEENGRAIRITEMKATMRDVKVSDNFSSAVADHAVGRAHVSYADLSKAAGPGITVGYAGKDDTGKSRVKISGGLLGFKISAYGTVSVVDGDTIRLRADKIPAGAVPGWEDKVRERTDIDRKVDGLPAGLKLKAIETTPEGVDIEAEGHAVELTG